ncbi:MAG TPA: glycosyltransferase [Chloroflexi bacterium]|nr:glycosyltransferase [Chloroflexota bacterium]
MHILHVYKDYAPVFGGIENHIQVLAQAQAAQGHQVTVLVTNPGGRPSRENDAGVTVIRAKRLATAASTPLSLDLSRQLAGLQPDVTHLHFPYPIGELSQLWAGRKRPYTITYHSDVVRQKVILRFYGPFLRRVLRGAGRIIVSSAPYIESSPWLRPYRDKCVVVPFGLDVERFGEGAQPLIPPAAVPTILFIGRHRYYKGVDDLIRAMAQVPARLLIGGDGPMRAEWERLAGALDLDGRIQFLGDIPDADLPAFYASGDIFTLPANSRAEAFGIVLQEAMAAGLPCVTTELGTGTSYLVQDGVSGFVVPPRQPDRLAGALNHLLADPELRLQMGQAGQRRARQEFTISHMTASIENVYRQLIDD